MWRLPLQVIELARLNAVSNAQDDVEPDAESLVRGQVGYAVRCADVTLPSRHKNLVRIADLKRQIADHKSEIKRQLGSRPD